MQELTDADFGKFISGAKPAVVDFWAPWCGPCRFASPIFDELSKEFSGKMDFAKMNIDDNSETPTKFGVFSIPTFLIFKSGELVGEIHGAMQKPEFREKLKEFI
ncbi:putative Thioredoxin [uncultured archaeon]|nr:putative Thioredoxin [uncultured archaeon]